MRMRWGICLCRMPRTSARTVSASRICLDRPQLSLIARRGASMRGKRRGEDVSRSQCPRTRGRRTKDVSPSPSWVRRLIDGRSIRFVCQYRQISFIDIGRGKSCAWGVVAPVSLRLRA